LIKIAARIRCPIHGFIELNEQEREIINQPVFQRLRRIKQLSLTDMVYPSATHTRFEHSLGVMHMATQMFNSIVSDEQNLEKLKIRKDDVFRFRKIIRLTALLHDVGHACFSHAGEDVMPFLAQDHPDYRGGRRYKHEHYSIAAIKVFFREHIEKDDDIRVDEVCFLLGDGKAEDCEHLIGLKGLINGSVDADRADYLLRDSYHLGVRYGQYDKERFINSITVGLHETRDAGGNYEDEYHALAIKESGLQMAEHMVMARYSMFSSVYFHKVRRVYDHHAEKALKEVLKSYKLEGGCFPPPSGDPKELQKYFDFDDWKVLGAIAEGRGDGEDEEHGKVILERRHYKLKETWHGNLGKGDREKLENLKKEHKFHIYDDSATTTWYKDDVFILRDTGETVFLKDISKMITEIGRPTIKRFYAPD